MATFASNTHKHAERGCSHSKITEKDFVSLLKLHIIAKGNIILQASFQLIMCLFVKYFTSLRISIEYPPHQIAPRRHK